MGFYGKKRPADSWENQPPEYESHDSHSTKWKTYGFPGTIFSSVLLTSNVPEKYKVTREGGQNAKDELDHSDFYKVDEPDMDHNSVINTTKYLSAASYHQLSAPFPCLLFFLLETH